MRTFKTITTLTSTDTMTDQTKSDSVEKIAEEMLKLKHCPFCGGEAERFSIDDAGHDDYGGQGVQCKDCGCSTNLTFACGDDPSEVISEKWNSRVCGHCGGSGELLKRFDGSFDAESCSLCGGSGSTSTCRVIPSNATAQEALCEIDIRPLPSGTRFINIPSTWWHGLPDGKHKIYTAPPPQPVSETTAQGSVPEGWKLVPIEPTDEMIDAGAQRLVRWEDGCVWPDSWDRLQVIAARQESERVYRSHVTAAPAAPRSAEAGR